MRVQCVCVRLSGNQRSREAHAHTKGPPTGMNETVKLNHKRGWKEKMHKERLSLLAKFSSETTFDHPMKLLRVRRR